MPSDVLISINCTILARDSTTWGSTLIPPISSIFLDTGAPTIISSILLTVPSDHIDI